MAMGRDVSLLVESAWCLARLPASYAENGFPRLLTRLGATKRVAHDTPDLARIGRITALAAARLPLAPHFGLCLKRALLRYAVLRKRGFPVTFHMGLRRNGGDFEGHAWVSLSGTPLWERSDPGSYHETFRFAGAPANRYSPLGR